jgi:hypothetical protein
VARTIEEVRFARVLLFLLPLVVLVVPGAPAPAAAADDGHVRLHWRTSGLREHTDRNGSPQGSVVLELFADGGTPAHVSCGRRSFASGFSPSPPDPKLLSAVFSYQSAHGEYGEVTRPSRGVLHLLCYGQDEVLPGRTPPKTAVVTADIRIPPGAVVDVAGEVEDVPPPGN